MGLVDEVGMHSQNKPLLHMVILGLWPDMQQQHRRSPLILVVYTLNPRDFRRPRACSNWEDLGEYTTTGEKGIER